MISAPAMRVAVKIMSRGVGAHRVQGQPVEILVDLLRGDEVFQLRQPREGAEAEGLVAEADPREDFVKLLGAALRRPPAFEAGQVPPDLLEGDAVAAVVAAIVAEAHRAAAEDAADDLGDLADAVILRVVADIEDLVVDGLA